MFFFTQRPHVSKTAASHQGCRHGPRRSSPRSRRRPYATATTHSSPVAANIVGPLQNRHRALPLLALPPIALTGRIVVAEPPRAATTVVIAACPTTVSSIDCTSAEQMPPEGDDLLDGSFVDLTNRQADLPAYARLTSSLK